MNTSAVNTFIPPAGTPILDVSSWDFKTKSIELRFLLPETGILVLEITHAQFGPCDKGSIARNRLAGDSIKHCLLVGRDFHCQAKRGTVIHGELTASWMEPLIEEAV